ncbi:MAG: ABC transporter permease [Planctomycetota bacterium]|nr:ABC transporter permease [Planctomycetota bacterium]
MNSDRHKVSKPAEPAEPPAEKGRSLLADARRKLVRDKGAMVCLVVIVAYSLLAVAGFAYEALAKRAADDNLPTFAQMADPSRTNEAPSLQWRNLMGADWLGRPVIVKTLLGAKVSMTVGLMANAIAVPLGMVLGAVAGYYGRRFDDVIVWLYTTLSSIPGIVLLIAMRFAFKGVTVLGLDLTGIHGLYIALGVLSWIGTCRLVRAETMKLRELDYVVAARASGRSRLAVLFRHILPNVMHLGIINFSLGFVGAIRAEVILSYLGLGVPVGTPSWGSMINAARLDLFQGRWWELTAAVGAMFLLVLALNIFGDRLRDALDPRLRNV